MISKKIASIVFIFSLSALSVFGTIIEVPNDVDGIQLAINQAIEGDTVLVHPGTYFERIDYLGKGICIGSFFLLTGDTTYVATTILDGSNDGSIVSFTHEEDSTSSIMGFTLQNGYAGFIGGGIYCSESSPLIDYVIIQESYSASGGGGIGCAGGAPIIKNSIIRNNDAGPWGGGLYFVSGSNPTLTNVDVYNNTVVERGAGIALWYQCHLTIRDSRIFNNNSTGQGGGAISIMSYCSLTGTNLLIAENTSSRGAGLNVISGSVVDLYRSVIAFNSASDTGGAIYMTPSTHVSLVNTTIYGNNAVSGTSGIFFSLGNSILYGGQLQIVNSILWNNSFPSIKILSSDTIVIAHSNIQDDIGAVEASDSSLVVWLDGNIFQDPSFLNPEDNDFQLSETSACIDAGTAFLTWQSDTLVNLETWSYQGNAPDMGGFESVYTSSTVKRESPNEFQLFANYPNPFNPNTVIEYDLLEQSEVSLIVYDITGRQIKTLVSEPQSQGNYQFNWDGTDVTGHQVAGGMYLARLQTGVNSSTIKMVYMR